MTEQMKKLLTMANSKHGAPGGYTGEAFYTAQKNGWLIWSSRPQNSMTCRYVLSEAGRKELEAAQSAA